MWYSVLGCSFLCALRDRVPAFLWISSLSLLLEKEKRMRRRPLTNSCPVLAAARTAHLKSWRNSINTTKNSPLNIINPLPQLHYHQQHLHLHFESPINSPCIWRVIAQNWTPENSQNLFQPNYFLVARTANVLPVGSSSGYQVYPAFRSCALNGHCIPAEQQKHHLLHTVITCSAYALNSSLIHSQL